jgi:hypothetical protein
LPKEIEMGSQYWNKPGKQRKQDWRDQKPKEPGTIVEITRRYYACAVSLAGVMGVPMSEQFLKEHRESISCTFIESGRTGVRLPDHVNLPQLYVPEVPATPKPANDKVPRVVREPETGTLNKEEPPCNDATSACVAPTSGPIEAPPIPPADAPAVNVPTPAPVPKPPRVAKPAGEKLKQTLVNTIRSKFCMEVEEGRWNWRPGCKEQCLTIFGTVELSSLPLETLKDGYTKLASTKRETQHAVEAPVISERVTEGGDKGQVEIVDPEGSQEGSSHAPGVSVATEGQLVRLFGLARMSGYKSLDRDLSPWFDVDAQRYRNVPMPNFLSIEQHLTSLLPKRETRRGKVA